MAAIAGDGFGRWPADQAAFGPRLPLAERPVIGIEQVVELRIEHRVARQIRFQQEGLEEPGDMGAVPFRRAGIGHRLDLLVLGAQRRSEEHTSELQSLMRISYAVFCLKKKKNKP